MIMICWKWWWLHLLFTLPTSHSREMTLCCCIQYKRAAGTHFSIYSRFHSHSLHCNILLRQPYIENIWLSRNPNFKCLWFATITTTTIILLPPCHLMFSTIVREHLALYSNDPMWLSPGILKICFNSVAVGVRSESCFLGNQQATPQKRITMWWQRLCANPGIISFWMRGKDFCFVKHCSLHTHVGDF